jgi:probable F420-dependent oxidoreductase
MRLGIAVRVMGPQATAETVLACARAAEEAGLDDLWVADHIAIPPDDAEGSEGRYLDPLATLAFLASATSRIGLGTGVLVLPYRPALPTAKWVATIQELSGGRLLLGVGVGWMEPEFRALGIDRGRRGAITDATLARLHECFASDEVELRGQRFLFRPRPPRPPILVGGAPPHALHRAVRYGDAWMPMAREPERIAPACERLRALAAEAGRAAPEVAPLVSLPLGDPRRARERALGFASCGATRLICAVGYRDAGEFREAAGALGELRSALAA